LVKPRERSVIIKRVEVTEGMREKLEAETVRKLIRQELDRAETEGLKLLGGLEGRALSEEERERTLKAIPGYRVWWSANGGVELGETRVISVKALEGGNQYQVVARCSLGVIRATEYELGQPVEENIATVRLVVSKALEITGFDFKWGEVGAEGR